MAPTNPPAHTWKVISQAPGSGKDLSGKFGPGFNVSYQVQPSGSVGTVFVPVANYNRDGVAAAVNAQAASVASVDGLTGGS